MYADNKLYATITTCVIPWNRRVMHVEEEEEDDDDKEKWGLVNFHKSL